MKKLLVINSSAKTLNSNSRKLTEIFVDRWRRIHINPIINLRELGNAHVPHVTQNWINAAFKPAATRSAVDIEALKVSDTYIAELREADIIVLGAPMYNWSVPSSLKAYIDQVLRVNETFKVDRSKEQQPYVGLLENKTLFMLLSQGEQGYEKGEHNEHMNFQTNYLKTVFNVMGVNNIHVVVVNGTSHGAEKLNKSARKAHQDIMELMEMELAKKTHR